MAEKNVELAYQVLDMTQQHAKHFSMATWAAGPSDWRDWPTRGLVSIDRLTSEADCGTTACFAGWTVALKGYHVSGAGNAWTSGLPVVEVSSFARELLGISYGEASQLFLDTLDEDIVQAVENIFGPRPEAM